MKLDIDTLVLLFVVTVIEYSITTRVLRIDPEISLSRNRDEIARQLSPEIMKTWINLLPTAS